MIIQQNRRFERQMSVARGWWLRNRDKAPEAFDEEARKCFDLARPLLEAPDLLDIVAGAIRARTTATMAIGTMRRM